MRILTAFKHWKKYLKWEEQGKKLFSQSLYTQLRRGSTPQHLPSPRSLLQLEPPVNIWKKKENNALVPYFSKQSTMIIMTIMSLNEDIKPPNDLYFLELWDRIRLPSFKSKGNPALEKKQLCLIKVHDRVKKQPNYLESVCLTHLADRTFIIRALSFLPKAANSPLR